MLAHRLDGGKGGKLLFTPPGYEVTIPAGYNPGRLTELPHRLCLSLGKSVADAYAYAYAKKLRMYSLSEADSPPKQRFVDPINDRYPTLPFYDERHFEDMADIMSVEPVKEQDKVMMGMLQSLGIEPGKPFAPDEKTKKVMRQTAIDAWFYLQEWFDNIPKDRLYWPDRHYASLLTTDANLASLFTYDDHIDLIAPAAEYFWCTYMPEELTDSPATQYLMAMADKDGKSPKPGNSTSSTFRRKCPSSNSGL